MKTALSVMRCLSYHEVLVILLSFSMISLFITYQLGTFPPTKSIIFPDTVPWRKISFKVVGKSRGQDLSRSDESLNGHRDTDTRQKLQQLLTVLTEHQREQLHQNDGTFPIVVLASKVVNIDEPFGVSLNDADTPVLGSSLHQQHLEYGLGVRSASPTPSTSAPVKQFQELTIKQPKGKEGKPIQLVINHIPIEIEEGKGVYEYAVIFNPAIDSRSFCFKLIYQHTEFFGPTKTFDGAKLYLPTKLREEVSVLDGVHPVDGSHVDITVKYIGKQAMEDCIHHFNVLLRRVMNSMELIPMGRNMYNPKSSIPIEKHMLELWPGYITAIQAYEGGLMLCAEVSHRVVRTQTVLDLMSEIQRNCPGNYRDECARQIIGTSILTRYNNRTYRIDDIKWDDNPTGVFTTTNGETISYRDFYKKVYNITITQLGQPLLVHNVRPKKNRMRGDEVAQEKMLCMIPELCYTTGLTDAMRSNFFVMKDIGMHTRVPPTKRQFELANFVREIYRCDKARELLEGWGVKIRPDLLQTQGRVLPTEKILVNNKVLSGGAEADWSRDITNCGVLQAVNIRSWVVLFVKRDDRKVQNFVSMASKVSYQMGIDVKRPHLVQLPDERNDTLNRFLRENITRELQIIVIVNPTSRDDRYNLIKKVCCVDCPVPSQVINARTIEKEQKLRSVTQKIMLQINCKLGGELWAVEIPIEKVMVIGIDAYHDKSIGNKSVLGFVFSVNRTMTRWSSQCGFQTRGEELGSALQTFTSFALKKYYEVNHFFPQNIIVFRDGVGDGQLDYVFRYEVDQLKVTFAIFGEDYKPSLTFAVVQKRINTRLLAVAGQGLDNPPPGTVVDHSVTRRNWKDFFLVSQHVRQGTVTPTHYVILYNDSNLLTADRIQRVAYKLTHLYYNWPGTIRVPAPCQYAHRLAAQVGMNIKTTPNPVLLDRLFFL